VKDHDLSFALEMADIAEDIAMRWFDPSGVVTTTKSDGTLVTDADLAVEHAMRAAVSERFPQDGIVGEEIGSFPGRSSRRWIFDGIDGTVFFAAGRREWGTLIALEDDGMVRVGVATSPTEERRWWAARGEGAFTNTAGERGGRQVRLRVSSETEARPDRFIVLPGHSRLDPARRAAIESLAGGPPPDQPWSHPMVVAEGVVDACVWFVGELWDLAAPSIIVEEAGGRFSDHWGGSRIDTHTAIFSNGARHDLLSATLSTLAAAPAGA